MFLTIILSLLESQRNVEYKCFNKLINMKCASLTYVLITVQEETDQISKIFLQEKQLIYLVCNERFHK